MNNPWFWIYLILAIAFEILMAFLLKASKGFKNMRNGVLGVLASYASIWFVMLAAQYAAICITYPLWTGVGAFGTTVIDVSVFKTPMPRLKLVYLTMALCGGLMLSYSLLAGEDAAKTAAAIARGLMSTLTGVYSVTALLAGFTLIFYFAFGGGSKGKAWIVLLAAIACEVNMSIALKFADGGKNLAQFSLGLAFDTGSVVLLTIASVHIALSIAYTMWSTLAGICIAICGVWLFGEAVIPLQIFAMLLTFSGVGGLFTMEKAEAE